MLIYSPLTKLAEKKKILRSKKIVFFLFFFMQKVVFTVEGHLVGRVVVGSNVGVLVGRGVGCVLKKSITKVNSEKLKTISIILVVI